MFSVTLPRKSMSTLHGALSELVTDPSFDNILRKNKTLMYSNFRNNTSYTKANPNYPKNVFLNSQFQLNLLILIIDEVHNETVLESN